MQQIFDLDLNRKIAEARQWTQIFEIDMLSDDHSRVIKRLIGHPENVPTNIMVPDWGWNTNEALELLKELPEGTLQWDGLTWRCRFFPDQPTTILFEQRVATAARAICLCWLAWNRMGRPGPRFPEPVDSKDDTC